VSAALDIFAPIPAKYLLGIKSEIVAERMPNGCRRLVLRPSGKPAGAESDDLWTEVLGEGCGSLRQFAIQTANPACRQAHRILWDLGLVEYTGERSVQGLPIWYVRFPRPSCEA